MLHNIIHSIITVQLLENTHRVDMHRFQTKKIPIFEPILSVVYSWEGGRFVLIIYLTTGELKSATCVVIQGQACINVESIFILSKNL